MCPEQSRKAFFADFRTRSRRWEAAVPIGELFNNNNMFEVAPAIVQRAHYVAYFNYNNKNVIPTTYLKKWMEKFPTWLTPDNVPIDHIFHN